MAPAPPNDFGESLARLEKYCARCDRLKTGTLSQLQVERVMRKLYPELLAALSAEELLGQLFKHSNRSRSGQNHVHYRAFLRGLRAHLAARAAQPAAANPPKTRLVGAHKTAPFATEDAPQQPAEAPAQATVSAPEPGYAWENIYGAESFAPYEGRPGRNARPPARTLKARCAFPKAVGVADPILHTWKVMPEASKYLDREQEVMPAGNVSYFHTAHIKPRLKRKTNYPRRIGEYDPVKHEWVQEPADKVYETRTDGESVEAMRGGTGGFTKRVGVYDPICHAWSAQPEDAAYSGRAGSAPGETTARREGEARVGVYDPIRHSWTVAPTDARYVDRAGPHLKNVLGGEEAAKLLHYGTGRKRSTPPAVLEDAVTRGTFLGPGKAKTPVPERCGVYDPIANSWTVEPKNKDYVDPPEPRMLRPASAPPSRTKLNRKLVTSEGKAFVAFTDRIGTYDPIKHVWQSPPTDPDFLDFWTGELVARPDYQQPGLLRRRRKRRLPASAFNPVVGKLVAWQ